MLDVRLKEIAFSDIRYPLSGNFMMQCIPILSEPSIIIDISYVDL